MEEDKKHLDELISHAEEYLRTRQELAQHVLTEKIVVLGSSTTASLIIFCLAIMALVFVGIAAALFISDYMQSKYSGFLIVGAFYLLTLIVLVIKRESWLLRPIMNQLIRTIYKEKSNGQN